MTAASRGRGWVEWVCALLGRVSASPYNPLRFLEPLCVWLFAIAVVSGLGVFVFYPLSPWEASAVVAGWSGYSVQGLLRSVHRYSSDALLVGVVLHGVAMALEGRFRRWLEWLSGLAMLGIVLAIGWSGFVLVWDTQAQLVGFLIARLLAGSGIFPAALARIFLTGEPTELGGFFRVALFGHIALTLLLLIGLWVHLGRLSRPRLLPPLPLQLWSAGALLAMALLFPVQSQEALGTQVLPIVVEVDPLYAAVLWLLRWFPPWGVWLVLGIFGIALAVLPAVGRKAVWHPQIDWERCDGCQQCALDCPYEAIVMRQFENGMKAQLVPERCVGCALCVAACPEHGIRSTVAPPLTAPLPGRVVLLTCAGMPLPERFARAPFVRIERPCVGSVHAEQLQELLRSHAVALVHCQRCVYRFGERWAIERLAGQRRPRIRHRALVQQQLLVVEWSPRAWSHLEAWAHQHASGDGVAQHHTAKEQQESR